MKVNVQFETGDVVRLVSKTPSGWHPTRMAFLLDTIQVVDRVVGNTVFFLNPMTKGWSFSVNDISNYEHLTLTASQLSLIAEAYTRFPEGTKFLSAMSGKRFTSKGLLYPKAENGYVNILDKGENYIYYRGGWANLRTANTLDFQGHKVEYHKNDDMLTVGCKNIDPSDLETLLNIADDYNITSITVDDSRNVPTSELQRWNDFINKQQ